MRKILEDFYNENKPLFEITAFVLIMAGLVLNVSSSLRFPSRSIEQLQFFLLLGSSILISILLSGFFSAVCAPILEKKSDKGETTLFLVRKIAMIAFFFLIVFLFVVNLLIYLIAAYQTEFIFLAIIVATYFVSTLLISKLPTHPKKDLVEFLYIFLLIFAFIGFPFGIYSIFYFGLPSTKTTFYLIASTIFLLTLILSSLVIFSMKNNVPKNREVPTPSSPSHNNSLK